ncbi:13779_t:CDS:2, partial [Funneliformis geosporum]
MAMVVARILPAPRLQYHTFSCDVSFILKDGSWNMCDKKVTASATLSSWAVITFGRYELKAVQNFIQELVNTCFDIEMNILNKSSPIQQVLSNTSIALYAEIKCISDTVLGVASQCVQSKHIFQAKSIPFISQQPTMIIGAAVSHPSPSSDYTRPNIAALYTSMNSKAS